ncbi:MAG: N-6 DNA methylase [Bacillota bacterium]|nr:N-6 DNA methylase [Bacillota bacterium]
MANVHDDADRGKQTSVSLETMISHLKQQDPLERKRTANIIAQQIADDLRKERVPENSWFMLIGVFATLAFFRATQPHNNLKEWLDAKTVNEDFSSWILGIDQFEAEHINKLAEMHDPSDLLATAVYADEEYSDPRSKAESATPTGIAHLALRLLDIRSGDRVADFGSGIGAFLSLAYETTNADNFIGIELQKSTLRIAQLRAYLLDQPIKYIEGDILSQDYRYLGVNRVFSNFPFAIRWSNLRFQVVQNPELNKWFSGSKTNSLGDWVFTVAAWLATREQGRVVTLMTAGATWSARDREIRKNLIEAGLVESVISLAPNLLPSTAISTCLLVLSQGNETVRLIEASDIVSTEKGKNSLEPVDIEKIMAAVQMVGKHSRDLTIAELEKEDFILSPHRHIYAPRADIVGTPLELLCTQIRRGWIQRKQDSKELKQERHDGLILVRLQDIEDGHLLSTAQTFVGNPECIGNHLLRENQVILSRNAPRKAAFIQPPEGKQLVISDSFYILDVNPDLISPAYLALYLSSQTADAQFARYEKGTVIRTINLKDLKRILVPIPPRKEQEKVVDAVSRINDELQYLSKYARKLRDRRTALIEEMN